MRSRLDSSCSPDLAWAALTDYASLARVFRNVLESRVEEAPGGAKTLVQLCKWGFLIFGGSFESVLAVEEDAAARRLAFRLVQVCGHGRAAEAVVQAVGWGGAAGRGQTAAEQSKAGVAGGLVRE